MAAILVVSNGPRGMIYTCLELCRRLQTAGHEVVFYGPQEHQALCHSNGLAFRALIPDQRQKWRQQDSQLGAWTRWRKRQQRRLELLASTQVDSFRQELKARQPDLVMLDAEMQEHILATLASGQRMMLLNTFASIWRLPHNPPLHLPIRPGKGWRGSPCGQRLSWAGYRLHKQWLGVRQWLTRIGSDRRSLLRAQARTAGFKLRRVTDGSHWLSPYIFPDLPVLCLHAAAFDFGSKTPASVLHAGPLILAERADALRGADAARLAAVLARHQQAGTPQRALIYVGLGSCFTHHEQWLQRLLQTVSQHPGWELILSLGGQNAPQFQQYAGEQVHIFDWLPQLTTLACADLAVVHGGINTIDECVMANVPMLVCNGGIRDMPGNTMRVLHHGIGLAADPQRDDENQLMAQLSTLLGDAALRSRLRSMRERYFRERDQQTLEKALETVLASEA